MQKNKTPEDYLAEVWVLAVTRENETDKKTPVNNKALGATGENEGSIYEHLPVVVTPPTEVKKMEVPYVTKLLEAYGSAENTDTFSKSSPSFPKYQAHFGRQREDFYAAESVRLSARKMFGEADPDHFEALMKEVYNVIIEIYETDYDNGLLRLKAVLDKATGNDVSVYWLKRRTAWIGASQKKGVCHMLANVNTIKSWVLING